MLCESGDYSRGAGGIVDRKRRADLSGAVSHMKEMFNSIEMIGNDLVWRCSTASPTIKITELTIAAA